ncbi:MAG: aminopeptidase [Nitrospinota bacterium]
MKEVLMMQGAHKIATVCADLKAGERVVIVTDFECARCGEIMAAACKALGAEVVMTVMEPVEVDGAEPPEAVALAMKTAQVLFLPVTQSISHSRATHEAVKAGARALSLAGFLPEMFYEGGINADFLALQPTCDALAARLERADKAELTTPGGTNMVFDLAGRPGNSHSCVPHTPGFTAVPNIEANTSPAEEGCEGLIVADAAVPNYRIGPLREPIRLKVEKGRIVDIQGGDQAQFLKERFAEHQDQAVYNIAQLAFGLNPESKICDRFLEMHGAAGTAHIGIGTSTFLGGTVRAPLHFDVVMYAPTLLLDGEKVIEDGKLLIEA